MRQQALEISDEDPSIPTNLWNRKFYDDLATDVSEIGCLSKNDVAILSFEARNLMRQGKIHKRVRNVSFRLIPNSYFMI